jgi:hypothetical protein
VWSTDSRDETNQGGAVFINDAEHQPSDESRGILVVGDGRTVSIGVQFGDQGEFRGGRVVLKGRYLPTTAGPLEPYVEAPPPATIVSSQPHSTG